MIRRPPRSTLFPSTTLCRSDPRSDQGRRRSGGDEARAPRHRERRVETKDRKSTRLNSNHHDISYAVFCLEKNPGEDTDGVAERGLDDAAQRRTRLDSE